MGDSKMDNTRLVNALLKIKGIKIEVEGTHHIVRNGERFITWRTQEHYQTGKALALGVRAPHPDTDMMTDYFCDSYFDTIKAATQYMREGN
jgi:hypothetical protein